MVDLSQGGIYLKSKFVSFFEGIGYIDCFVPSDVASRKQGKWYIETRLMVDIGSKETMKIIFCECHREFHFILNNPLVFYFLNFLLLVRKLKMRC